MGKFLSIVGLVSLIANSFLPYTSVAFAQETIFIEQEPTPTPTAVPIFNDLQENSSASAAPSEIQDTPTSSPVLESSENSNYETTETTFTLNDESGLKAVSPTNNADNGFPDWYQDDSGAKVVQDPTLPALSSGNFPDEFFYWSAEASLGENLLVLAAEASFLDDKATAGEQATFGRLRIKLEGLTPNSTYTVTHPYGVEIMQTDENGEARNDNDDIGCKVAPCNFAQALDSPVFKSFLRWDTDAPQGFLGDSASEHTVTGSPTGNNIFRIEGPGLVDGKIETDKFVVLGKLFTVAPTPPLECEDKAPEIPTLTSPLNEASGTSVNPVLNWNEINDFGINCLGHNNQFEIFLDKGHVDPTTSFGLVNEATFSKLIVGLSSDTTFSWKVRAKNGALSSDSEIQTFTTASAAGSRAVSPNFDSDNSYPAWYRDDSGIMVMPCLDGSDINCVLPGSGEEPQWNPEQKTDFPDNFPSEFFYWIAESEFLNTDPQDIDGDGNNGKVGIRFAVEGAFLNEDPAPADQVVFGRIRVTGNELQPNSTYTVTHPYGIDTYQTNDIGIITRGVGTEDIGCTDSLCNFADALDSRVFGSFLRHTTAPEGYLGDAVSLNPITGSPLEQNFFKIEGPGLPEGGLQTQLFTVSGKILVSLPEPPPGCVNSAPNQPELLNPVNGALDVSTNPLLTWENIESFGVNCLGGRDQFEVFLTQGNAEPTESKGSVINTQTGFNLLNLLPATTYSWKVRASNLELFTDSLVRIFTTTPIQSRAVSSDTKDNGFPSWYQDDNAKRVMPCLDADNPQCVLPDKDEEPNFDPENPTVFPENFPSEFFYWIAESDPIATPHNGDVSIRYALEGAFLDEDPAPLDQSVFGRIRVRATGLKANSPYIVTHAYGVDVFETDENGNITSVLGTEDIGCFVRPCDFSDALASRTFSGFLEWDQGAPLGYLGDVTIPHAVTGSPLGQNFFRIEGPQLPNGGLQTNLFTVSGKLFSEVPPPPPSDTKAPALTSFSSTTADGAYGPGSNINVTADFDETLGTDSAVTVILDTGAEITLNALFDSKLTGTYIVGPTGSGQNSPDLTVASIVSIDVSDLSGNHQTSTALPASNIAITKNIAVDTIAPSGSISINNGAGFTNSTAVTLSFANVSANVKSMQLRNGTTGAFQTVVPFENPRSYNLPNIQGERFLSVRFIDTAGNQSLGVISDSIVFDNIAPSDPQDVSSISHSIGKNSTDNTIDMVWSQPELPLGAKDAVSGVAGYSVSFTQSAADSPDTILDLSSDFSSITSPALSSGDWFFHLRTLDNAGNWTSTVHAGPFSIVDSGTITIIKDTIPDDPQDFVFGLQGENIDQRFTLDDDSDNSNEFSNTVVFAEMFPGIYTLEELQEGSVGNFTLHNIVCQDADGKTTIDLNSRTAHIDLEERENIVCTFTNLLKQSISGVKFNDLNANGVRDPDEPGLSGWTIFLDGNNNDILDNNEFFTTTDANGNYEFINVGNGTVNIREIEQNGWAQTTPLDDKYTLNITSNASFANQDFGNSQIFTVFEQGRFISTGGQINSTSSVNADDDSVISITGNEGLSTIAIPKGTVITRTDGEVFDFSLFTASIPSILSVSGLGSDIAVDGVLQWGIPGIGFLFSKPITINLFVGNTFNGQTLNIKRSISPTSGWTDEGIVAPSSCVIVNGLCSFQATRASFYTAYHTVTVTSPTPTPIPTPAPITSSAGNQETNNEKNTGSSNSNNNSVSCGDSAPGSAPTLTSAIDIGNGKITLSWSKAADPVTHYTVTYGLTPNNPLYGNPNIGGKNTTSYTVSELSPNTVYYFRVGASNGCKGGQYSNELSAGSNKNEAVLALSDQDEDVLGSTATEDVLGTEKKEPEKPNNTKNFIINNLKKWPVQAILVLVLLGLVKVFFKKSGK